MAHEIMTLLTPVTGINTDSTVELSDRAVTIALKETITTIQGWSFKQRRQKGWKGKTSTNNERNSWSNIEKEGKHINQLNEGPDIKLHRCSRTQGRKNNYSLLRINFPTMVKSDILDINKGGIIVSMKPYTKT